MDKWQDLSKGGFQPGDYSLSCGKRGKMPVCRGSREVGESVLRVFLFQVLSFLRHDCFPASDVFCGFFLLVIMMIIYSH